MVGDYNYSEILLMQISYDSKYNIAYIKFLEKEAEVNTLALSDDVNIDISPDGKIFGIELLNANEQLKTADKLMLINEAAGKSEQINWIQILIFLQNKPDILPLPANNRG